MPSYPPGAASDAVTSKRAPASPAVRRHDIRSVACGYGGRPARVCWPARLSGLESNVENIPGATL